MLPPDQVCSQNPITACQYLIVPAHHKGTADMHLSFGLIRKIKLCKMSSVVDNVYSTLNICTVEASTSLKVPSIISCINTGRHYQQKVFTNFAIGSFCLFLT